MKGALLLALGMACPAWLQAVAQIEFDDAADVGFATLAVPMGVRATGMGEAHTASGRGVDALGWNPAGLSAIEGYEIALAHNEWVSTLGMRQDLVGYGQKLGLDRGLGLSVDYFGLGQLEQRDSSGALTGHSDATMLAFKAGYAQPLFSSNRLRAGAVLEYAQQTLYDRTQMGLAGSVGLLYEVVHDLSAGLSLNHVGAGMEGSSLPGRVQAGLAGWLMERRALLAFDADLPFRGAPMLKAGLEIPLGQVALRAGWRQVLGGQGLGLESGFSAGLGIKAGIFRLDYSFTPYGDLNNAHRVQVTVDMPEGYFSPRMAGPEGTTTTAEAYYSQAQGLEKNGERLKALIQYQRCLESYPQAMKKTAQTFYLVALNKVDELQAALSKSSDHGQIQKLTKESLASAQDDLKAGRYREALAQLKQAKLIDPNNLGIDKMANEVRSALDERLKTFREAARFGVNENNLPMAVENYRKLLNLDHADADALAYMHKHRSDIKEMLQASDRKAIYFYVAGKLEEALKVWHEAEALDYFGDVDLKRNIDKARKQLDQGKP